MQCAAVSFEFHTIFFDKQDKHIRIIERKAFFLHKVLYVHLLQLSAAEEIEPIALRLRAQSLAAELSASRFTQFFTELGKKKKRIIAAGDCCLAITEKKSLLHLFLALVIACYSD